NNCSSYYISFLRVRSPPITIPVRPIKRKVFLAAAFLSNLKIQGADKEKTPIPTSPARCFLKESILNTPHSARVTKAEQSIIPLMTRAKAAALGSFLKFNNLGESAVKGI